MTKDLTHLNETAHSRNKKYIDIVFWLDEKNVCKNKEANLEKTYNTLDDYVKNLDETFSQKYMNEFKSKKNIVMSHNPNLYRESLHVLLEQELMRQYYVNGGFPKVKKIDFKEINKPAVAVKTKKNVVGHDEIENIDDLLKLIDSNPLDDSIEYNINIESLHKIKPYLLRLKNMIGMKTLKKNIVDQLLYFIQDFHIGGKGMSRGDYLHTVIYGPPGTGKTHIAKIIGKIFSKLGILKKGVFKKVTRSDLVAGYLGQTALKTKDVINECLDGVLFIDEAYSLGNSEKKDSFSKECIDTLCEALSNHKENLMVIIAGYESELNDCFFNYNKGLDSRFTWRFKIDNYDGCDLYKIFLKKISDYGWKFDESLKEEWFIKNLPYFTFFGRDMEILFSKTKIAHSRRVFCKSMEEKKIITSKDLEKGFEMFMENDEVKKRKESECHKFMINTLYV
jgi:SpoVK/Ycf46/Vps4 family AAA+-type ATPase